VKFATKLEKKETLNEHAMLLQLQIQTAAESLRKQPTNCNSSWLFLYFAFLHGTFPSLPRSAQVIGLPKEHKK
jgi:hypothetical protein